MNQSQRPHPVGGAAYKAAAAGAFIIQPCDAFEDDDPAIYVMSRLATLPLVNAAALNAIPD